MVMKGFYGIWLVCLIWCVTPAGAGVVRNGSFEMDGPINYVTANTRPRYWCDVSYNPSIFSANLDNNWKTDGSYSLALFTNTFVTFEPNGTATISQSVYLNSVAQIIFDIFLYAGYGSWDPNIVTARILIDGNETWNSDGLTFVAGQFSGEIAIDVNGIYKDEKNHVMSLQLRTDSGTYSYAQYVAQWDNVRFYAGCSGSVPGDFTGDCVVDINDLAFFAKGWLKSGGPDFTGDGVINFADFAVFADFWQDNLLDADLNKDGIVDYGDILVFSENWLGDGGPVTNFADSAVFADFWGVTSEPGSTAQPPQDNLLDADLNDDGIVDYGDVLMFSEDWLGDGGPCVRADLNDDGIVDFVDFAILAESWQQTGSLYGW